MWEMTYPIILVVLSNMFYHICSKSTPSNANSFAMLTITYGVAAVMSFVLFFITSKGRNLFVEWGKANWAPLVLGIVIVGLELGYIFAYRNGWDMSTASVTSNIILAVVLVFVAAIVYKETITLRQILGIIVCSGGLVLISL